MSQITNRPAEDFSSLPEAVENSGDGIEVVASQGKEVAGAEEKELQRGLPHGPDGLQVIDTNPPEEIGDRGGNTENPPKRTRRRRRFIYIAAIVVLVLAIGLGVGLGVGLDNSGKASEGGGAQYLSTRGALNGTAITWTAVYGSTNLTSQQPQYDENWQKDDKFLFFQHHTGSIRWMYQSGPSNWSGGSVYEVITTDAKTLTPLSVMSPGDSGGQAYDLYYVNKDNYLSQLSINSSAYTWAEGPLNKLQLKVLDTAPVGMKACLNLGPIAGVPASQTVGHGTRLFVATGGTTFEQYSWYPDMADWVYEQTWHNLNGHASPACFGWGKGHTFYVWFVNSGNDINMYWRDTANKTSTATHPINSWALSSLIFPAVEPSNGLDFHFLLYGKLATGNLQGWNMTLEAENSTLGTTSLTTIHGRQPIPNSQISVTSTPPFGGDHTETISLFYQVEGDDITMLTGVPSTGVWNSTKLNIPDD